MTVESAWLSRLSWVAIFSSESYLFCTWPGPGTVVEDGSASRRSLPYPSRTWPGVLPVSESTARKPAMASRRPSPPPPGTKTEVRENSALSCPGICMVR